MRSAPSVAIPERMRHLKVDHRGYPVPAGVVYDSDGNPHFAVNDEWRRREFISKELCSVCGTKLFRGKWFVGGALSAFHQDGAFIDPPMHSECAHYALQVCPYLALAHYRREIGKLKAEQASFKEAAIMLDNTMMPGRPHGEMFVAIMSTKPTVVFETYNIKPGRPFAKVEYWRHGQQLSETEGERLVAEAIEKFQSEIKK